MPETRTDMLLATAIDAADVLRQIGNGKLDVSDAAARAIAAHAGLSEALAQWSVLPCDHCGEMYEDVKLFRVEIRTRRDGKTKPAPIETHDTRKARWCAKCLHAIASTVVIETSPL